MTLEEVKKGAPDGAEYWHKNLGYLKDVFGKRVKAKIWIDDQWRPFNIWQSLTHAEFSEIKPL